MTFKHHLINIENSPQNVKYKNYFVACKFHFFVSIHSRCQSPQMDEPLCSGRQERVARSQRYCGLFKNPNSAFKVFRACQLWANINVEKYVESCMTDVCAILPNAKKAKRATCEILEDFAAACAKAHVPVRGWRSQTGCSKYF